ncbi:hypothetical protein Sjap_025355 [Stephania japonica]|uniref:Uncharacterized protein n=1 Tax=Stephania japonica TaxID=461633 RepID=A0AAP0HFH6_9MAGN
MGKALGALVCLVIIGLDVVAGILGIQAESAQDKVKHLRMWIFECKEPSKDAFNLAIAAAGLLTIAHVVANLLSGCACIWSKDEFDRSSINKQLATGCLVLSWIIFVAGMAVLVIGAMANSKSRSSCGMSHHRFLSMGGIACFVHGLLSVSHYICANAKIEEEKSNNTGNGAP